MYVDYSRVIKEVADTLETITWGLARGVRSSRHRVDSLTLFIASIMLAITGAYSGSHILKLSLIIFSVLVLILLSNVKIIRSALKTYLYVNAFAFFLGLPTLFIHRSSNVLISILETMLTVSAASSPMIMLFVLIGLQNIIRALGFLSRSLEAMISMFIALIPKISRIVSDMIVARISRNIGGSTRNTWSILSTSIADAIVHTNALAQNIVLAMMSRNIGSHSNSRIYVKFKPIDIVVLLSIATVMILSLMVLK